MRNLIIALMLSTAAASAQGQAIDESAMARADAIESARSQSVQRDDGRRGNWSNRGDRQARQAPAAQAEAPRQRMNGGNDGRRGDGWRARQRAEGTPAPVLQQPVQQAQTRQGWNGNRGNWDGNRGNRGDGVNRQRWDGDRGRVLPVPVPPQPGSSIDRNRDGQVDRYYDRNRNGRLDRNWDRNRDGSLDRRYDRNRDGQLDRRFDRNDNDRLDRRYDRDRDGRYDRFDRRDDRFGRSWNNWNRGWRNDRRYDWQGWRSRNRHYYSAPRYYNPYGYGYGYQRFGIGIYLDSLFFSNRYWINDPWQYRLPTAPYGARWVRYYNDVLLVDIDSGYVIDVIHDFYY